MTPPVPRLGRLLDGVGALVFFVGAGVYGWTWWNLRTLEVDPTQPPADRLTFAALDRFVELQELARVGLVLMLVGAAVAVAAALVAARHRRRHRNETSPP